MPQISVISLIYRLAFVSFRTRRTINNNHSTLGELETADRRYFSSPNCFYDCFRAGRLPTQTLRRAFISSREKRKRRRILIISEWMRNPTRSGPMHPFAAQYVDVHRAMHTTATTTVSTLPLSSYSSLLSWRTMPATIGHEFAYGHMETVCDGWSFPNHA